MSDAVTPPAGTEPIIRLDAVNKWYGTFQVLTDIDLSVRVGERIVICGPSGSGKSTLIRCINRLETVQKGRIVVDGIELTAGGKNVYVDRVEWLIIRDAQTQMNALLNGEADILEQPAFEQYATLRTNPDIKLVDAQPAGNQFILRFNFLQPPFNNEDRKSVV